MPGISVPMKIPYDASRPVASTPLAQISTAAQNRAMITTVVYRPLCAKLGANTYASVLAT